MWIYARRYWTKVSLSHRMKRIDQYLTWSHQTCRDTRLGCFTGDDDKWYLCNLPCAYWPASLMSTNSWSQLSNSVLQSEQQQQHRCQMLRGDLWLVRRGGCFRIPRRAVRRRASWRGNCRVSEEASTVTAQGSNGPPSGSRDALHARQHADPTGVYPASVNDSCHACRRTHARVGRPGEWLIDCFIYLATQRCSYLRSVRMSTCSLQLCSGLKYSAWWKQQTVKTTSGARSVRMPVCCSFSSLPWCTKLKTHVAQLSASSCACSFCCLHDWSKIIL